MSVAVAAGLAAVAFGAKGGSELSRLTAVAVALTVAGGVACGAAVLLTPRRQPRGTITTGFFVLLAVITALSIGWSVTPGESWIEANRTLAYLAVFIGAVALGNLGPAAGEAVLRGVLAAAVVVVGYALASRVWPAQLADLEIYARIGQPFGYWNAVGVTAALALPLTLWLGSRRHGSPAVSALAYPVTGLLTVALFLTYSRSALLAAVVVLVLWLLFVPLRLRGAAIVAAAGAAAAPVIVWASGQAAFTEDGVETAVREDAATTFGLLLLALVVALYAAGLGAAALRRRVQLTSLRREQVGRALAAVLAVAALAGVGAVALSERGLGGTVSDRWNELTDDSATTTGGPDRLGSAASSRSRYWRQAVDVFGEDPVTGSGAGGFATASLRFRDDPLVARHAHGYVVQTLADLGLLGLLATLALAFSWLVAAIRAVGATPRSRLGQLFLIGRPERVDRGLAPAWTADRLAVCALFFAAIAYGLQSLIDWTWFVPGPTVMALVAAGFVAGRGPAPEAAAPPEPSPRPRPDRPRVALAALAVAAALAASWSIWQPERADQRVNDAVTLANQGDFAAAVDAARQAQDIDPLALRPVLTEAALHQRAGRNDDALRVFQQAVADHPDDPRAWRGLGDFELYDLDRPDAALTALDQALYLDPMSLPARDSFIEARTRLRERGVLPAEPQP